MTVYPFKFKVIEITSSNVTANTCCLRILRCSRRPSKGDKVKGFRSSIKRRLSLKCRNLDMNVIFESLAESGFNLFPFATSRISQEYLDRLWSYFIQTPATLPETDWTKTELEHVFSGDR